MSDENAFDLYDDLDNALIQPLDSDIARKQAEEEAKLEADRKIAKLIEEKDLEYEALRKRYDRMHTNCSILMGTAKSEIERKDKAIDELRRQLDGLIFRKTSLKNNQMVDKFIQFTPITRSAETQTSDYWPQHRSSETYGERNRSIKEKAIRTSREAERSTKSRESERSNKNVHRNGREKPNERKHEDRHRDRSRSDKGREKEYTKTSSNRDTSKAGSSSLKELADESSLKWHGAAKHSTDNHSRNCLPGIASDKSRSSRSKDKSDDCQKNSRKRSRSKSSDKRRSEKSERDKRRKQDEATNSKHDIKTEFDLREILLRKKSSDVDRNRDKIDSKHNVKPEQSYDSKNEEDMNFMDVESVKSTESDVEIVDVLKMEVKEELTEMTKDEVEASQSQVAPTTQVILQNPMQNHKDAPVASVDVKVSNESIEDQSVVVKNELASTSVEAELKVVPKLESKTLGPFIEITNEGSNNADDVLIIKADEAENEELTAESPMKACTPKKTNKTSNKTENREFLSELSSFDRLQNKLLSIAKSKRQKSPTKLSQKIESKSISETTKVEEVKSPSQVKPLKPKLSIKPLHRDGVNPTLKEKPVACEPMAQIELKSKPTQAVKSNDTLTSVKKVKSPSKSSKLSTQLDKSSLKELNSKPLEQGPSSQNESEMKETSPKISLEEPPPLAEHLRPESPVKSLPTDKPLKKKSLLLESTSQVESKIKPKLPEKSPSKSTPQAKPKQPIPVEFLQKTEAKSPLKEKPSSTSQVDHKVKPTKQEKSSVKSPKTNELKRTLKVNPLMMKSSTSEAETSLVKSSSLQKSSEPKSPSKEKLVTQKSPEIEKLVSPTSTAVIVSKQNLPISVSDDPAPIELAEKAEPVVVLRIEAPNVTPQAVNEQVTQQQSIEMLEQTEDLNSPATPANDSTDSIKENSLNLSQSSAKGSRSYTKTFTDEGIAVFTISRKKKKKLK